MMKISRNVLFGLVIVLTNVFFILIVSTELRYGKDARNQELPLFHPSLLSRRKREQRESIVRDRLTRRQLRNVTATTTTTTKQEAEELQEEERPPLGSIIDENDKVTGDSQFLLDFAIIGFGKCGTSTMLQWLDSHPEVQCLPEEIWDLMHSRPQGLIRKLYSDLPPDEHYQRGYKCPGDITQPHILQYFETLWPKTKLFVGIRHPVRYVYNN